MSSVRLEARTRESVPDGHRFAEGAPRVSAPLGTESP